MHCCGQVLFETNYQMLCTICGQIYYEIYQTNYIYFYVNMYKIRKKSVYIRKYRIQNVLSDIELKNKLQISRDIINRVCKVLPQINRDRKRIISIKFIIHSFSKFNVQITE